MIPFTLYYGITNTIHQNAKFLLREGTLAGTKTESNYKIMLQKDLSSAFIYEQFIKNPMLCVATAEKWESILQVCVDEEFIAKAFTNIKVIDTLHRMLHNSP